MKIRNRDKLNNILMAFGFTLASATVSAATITMEMDHAFSGSPTTPVGGVGSEWSIAQFIDVTGGVQLILSGSGLVPDTDAGSKVDPQHIGKAKVEKNGNIKSGEGDASSDLGWFFNVASAQVGNLTFTEQSRVGTFSTPVVVQHSNFFHPTAGGLFDINVQFAEGDADSEFTSGDSITFLITSSVLGLTASSFNQLSAASGGDSLYYSAAWVENGSTGWVNPSTLTVTTPPTSVPDSVGTAVLMGVGLLGLGLFNRKNREA